MVRKISASISNEQLQEDLEKYRQRSIELGATDAKILSSDAVVIDERVRAKCMYPKCDAYGTNAHCPPHAMDLDQVRRTVKSYRYGIFIRIEARAEDITGPEARKKRAHSLAHAYGLVGTIESEAFYDGHHLALGYACGPCKAVFCPAEECSALSPGQACRHPLKARSSMEAVGMDVYTMAARVGWDIYPIGRRTSPDEVPFGAAYALVMIH